MAKYTHELRDVVANYNIFAFQYPFYNEKERKDFETAFVRHFYFREICTPSINQFLVFMEDKFNIVFPYYNELLRTATIEYDIENPYKLTETYKRKVDTSGKTKGVSSSVGQVFDTSNSETNEQNSSVHSDSVKRDESSSQEQQGKSLEKNLDTPQGAFNLDDHDYISALKSNESESSESSSVTSNQQSSGTNSTNGKSEATSESERRTTEDANTRQETQGNEIEEYVLERKGNIGVNPASFEIDKHIDTQKTLKKIYQLFFDECEDLFMMVY